MFIVGPSGVKRLLLALVAVLILGIVVDMLYVAVCPDVGYLVPLHKCERNIVQYSQGGDVSCPLSKGGEEYYVLKWNERREHGECAVVVADRRLFHSQRVSLFGPLQRFAVVLLNDGRAEVWVGSEERYQEALGAAAVSAEACRVEKFYKDAKNRGEVVEFCAEEY